RRVAFVRGNPTPSEGNQRGSDLIIRWLSDGTESTVAHDDVSIRGIVWSPDGASVAYTGGSKIVHHDESPAYSGAKIIYRVSEYVRGQMYALRLAGGKPIAISKPGEYGGLAWIDPTHLVFDGESEDFKKYFIYLADASSGSTRAIHEIDEEKFWSIPDWGEAGAQPWPSPNGKWIAFLSDQDGWDHIYVMAASGGDAVQITKGHFEAWRPAWSHDSTRIAFDANLEDHPGDRAMGIDRSRFIEPQFVHYLGPDGQQVPGWLFVPKNLDRTKKHPAIIWIHGDGVNQNYDGWHVQRNYAVYYSFHQYLLQQGYVVFAP